MYFSRFNIFSKIKDSDNYFIVNLLSGHADILNTAEAEQLKLIRSKQKIELSINKELIENGYIIDRNEEESIYKNKYLDFIDSQETDEVQLFFVPNYSCNFACTYCYQDQYENSNKPIDTKIIDAFFKYVNTEFALRKKYITIFGGEPLLTSIKQKETIKYILNKATQHSIDISVVSNGYGLFEYIDILKTTKLREIQITLDGTEDLHNQRRYLKGGKGTFEQIVKGIDACLENKITLNLRMVVDKENISNLPHLAQFAIDKHWTSSPYFKTQIGRNYELHHCQSAPDNLFTRISLYEEIYSLIKQNPHILEFYKPAYSISKFLWENGELPDPLFDACPACKTEWAFDYTGHIYSCTATVGKANESLGTFYPSVNKNNDKINEWEKRNVTEINKCSECNLQLACGGGCGAISKNNTGTICAPDCRPITELLELGFSQYLNS